MFTLARTLVQNKLFLVALALVGYMLFAGNKEAPKPKNAWDTVAAAPSYGGTEAKTSLTDKALKLLNEGAKMAGVEEYMPQALQEQAVSGLNKTEEALNAVTKGQE